MWGYRRKFPRFFHNPRCDFEGFSHNKKAEIKNILSLQPNNTQEWILNKPFRLPRVSLVNWLNPRLVRIITITKFPFLRNRTHFLDILFPCAQFSHHSRPPIGKEKNTKWEKRSRKNCRRCRDVREILSSGNAWYENWVAIICVFPEAFCFFKKSLDKLNLLSQNKNWTLQN